MKNRVRYEWEAEQREGEEGGGGGERRRMIISKTKVMSGGLLFRGCGAHVLQLHFFVRSVILLGVVLRARRWRDILGIKRSRDGKSRRVVARGRRLNLHGGHFAVAATDHFDHLLCDL